MAGKIPMGQKELIRAKVMEQVAQKQLSLKEAALKRKLSYRQAKRIYRRYLREGDQGCCTGAKGRFPGKRMILGYEKQRCACTRSDMGTLGRPLQRRS